MLFGEPEPNKTGNVDVPGRVNNNPPTPQDTLKSAIADHYKN